MGSIPTRPTILFIINEQCIVLNMDSLRVLVLRFPAAAVVWLLDIVIYFLKKLERRLDKGN